MYTGCPKNNAFFLNWLKIHFIFQTNTKKYMYSFSITSGIRMKNNIIQMSSLSLLTGCNAVEKISNNCSVILSGKIHNDTSNFFFQITYGSQFCCVNLGFDISPEEKITRSEIAWSCWPVHITSTCNKMIRENLMLQSIGLYCTVSGGIILLKPQFCEVHIFKIRPQKIVDHFAIPFTVNCDRLSSLILKEKGTDHALCSIHTTQ